MHSNVNFRNILILPKYANNIFLLENKKKKDKTSVRIDATGVKPTNARINYDTHKTHQKATMIRSAKCNHNIDISQRLYAHANNPKNK